VRRRAPLPAARNGHLSAIVGRLPAGLVCVLPAARCAKAIRHHWHIENRSHYVRDGSFAEDASRIRRNPGIFARLRSFAANILRFNGIHNISYQSAECLTLAWRGRIPESAIA